MRRGLFVRNGHHSHQVLTWENTSHLPLIPKRISLVVTHVVVFEFSKVTLVVEVCRPSEKGRFSGLSCSHILLTLGPSCLVKGTRNESRWHSGLSKRGMQQIWVELGTNGCEEVFQLGWLHLLHILNVVNQLRLTRKHSGSHASAHKRSSRRKLPKWTPVAVESSLAWSPATTSMIASPTTACLSSGSVILRFNKRAKG